MSSAHHTSDEDDSGSDEDYVPNTQANMSSNNDEENISDGDSVHSCDIIDDGDVNTPTRPSTQNFKNSAKDEDSDDATKEEDLLVGETIKSNAQLENDGLIVCEYGKSNKTVYLNAKIRTLGVVYASDELPDIKHDPTVKLQELAILSLKHGTVRALPCEGKPGTGDIIFHELTPKQEGDLIKRGCSTSGVRPNYNKWISFTKSKTPNTELSIQEQTLFGSDIYSICLSTPFLNFKESEKLKRDAANDTKKKMVTKDNDSVPEKMESTNHKEKTSDIRPKEIKELTDKQPTPQPSVEANLVEEESTRPKSTRKRKPTTVNSVNVQRQQQPQSTLTKRKHSKNTSDQPSPENTQDKRRKTVTQQTLKLPSMPNTTSSQEPANDIIPQVTATASNASYTPVPVKERQAPNITSITQDKSKSKSAPSTLTFTFATKEDLISFVQRFK